MNKSMTASLVTNGACIEIWKLHFSRKNLKEKVVTEVLAD